MSGLFNGVDQGVTLVNGGVGSSYLNNINKFSFSGWVQVVSEIVGNIQIIYFRNNAGTNPNNARLEVQLTASAPVRRVQLNARAPDISAGVSLFSTGVIPIEPNIGFSAPSQFIAVTIDYVAQVAKIYINGVLDSTFAAIAVAAATDATNTDAASMGFDFQATAQSFNGKLSDLRFYKGVVLTDDQVKTIYRMNGHDGFYGAARKDLQLRYQLGEEKGGALLTTANVIDSSPAQVTNGFPFAMFGAPVYSDEIQAFRRTVP
jgi:hypothetical protein